MLYHASIPADDPERVARVIAELWGGRVLKFAPFPGAYMAWSGDERRTVVDVYPRGREHVPAPGEFGVRTNPAPSPYSESHLALGVAVSGDEILAIARREDWLAQTSDRGGLFSVVELWIENKFLLELLTPQEQRRYAANMTIENLQALFDGRSYCEIDTVTFARDAADDDVTESSDR